MEIPEIKQIQRVAQQGKWRGNGKFDREKWQHTESGRRTTIEALPSAWAVPISVEEIELDDVKKFCYAVCEIRYSTKMNEDLKIRKKKMSNVGIAPMRYVTFFFEKESWAFYLSNIPSMGTLITYKGKRYKVESVCYDLKENTEHHLCHPENINVYLSDDDEKIVS